MSTGQEEQPESPTTTPDDPFWLVIIGDNTEAQPQCIECPNAESLQEAVSQHVLGAEEDLFAFAFKGKRIELGAPRPVCSIRIGEDNLEVGKSDHQYNASGRIQPLQRPAE